MPLETISALATVLGTAVSILALIQASGCLAILSCLCVCIAVGFWFWARRQRSLLSSAQIVIEGQSIDSLNLANLYRKVNRDFFIQEAHHTARIKGEDLEITWRYTGFCQTDNVASMDFSVDSEVGSAFDDLDCTAFDLGRDPEMKHKIKPMLAGPDGIQRSFL